MQADNSVYFTFCSLYFLICKKKMTYMLISLLSEFKIFLYSGVSKQRSSLYNGKTLLFGAEPQFPHL